SKMFRFNTHADRCITILSAGNLATTQCVIEQINRDLRENSETSLNSTHYLSDTADYVGDVLNQRIKRYSEDQQSGFSPDATLLLAGQIKGQPPQAFLIYPQGNHITTSRETPYLQIGESKYGKPVLDRFLTMQTSLTDAATCALISMDSTMKSNVSVGPPIEVLVYETDSLVFKHHYRFDAEDTFLINLRREWGNKLNQAFKEMPRIPEAFSTTSTTDE
ncbi:proteasome-type protease, partial [Methylophaga sp. UBA5088]